MASGIMFTDDFDIKYSQIAKLFKDMQYSSQTLIEKEIYNFHTILKERFSEYELYEQRDPIEFILDFFSILKEDLHV